MNVTPIYKTRVPQYFSVLLLIGGTLVCTSQAATFSGAGSLESLQQADANLVHQYTFAPTATADKEGSNNLTLVGTNTSDISFADETLSFTTTSGTRSLTTSSAITMSSGNSYTLEFLMRPSVSDVGSTEAHIFSSIKSDRLYIYQQGSSLKMRLGDESTGSYIQTLGTISSSSAYYVALNFTFSDPTPGSNEAAGSGDATYTVDAWLGDVSGTITQVLTSQVFGASDTLGGFSEKLKIGAFFYTDANAWNGDLDSIAWYDSALSETAIMDHYAAVPESSSFALLLSTGALALVCFKRK